MLDRAKLFAALRAAPFGRGLFPSEVQGIGAILDVAPVTLTQEHLAYCLATSYHETARTMQPIKEYGGDAYYTSMYDIKGSRPAKARELGNVFPGDGAKFCGRGYVQLTGRSNYARAAGITNVDLVDNPDLAMRDDVAARIMFSGMSAGWFTGKKLSDYFSDARSDPVNARRIINGLDCADAIATYYRAFLGALKAATVPDPAVVAPAPPAPRVAAAQPPAHLVEAPRKGFLDRLAAIFRS